VQIKTFKAMEKEKLIKEYEATLESLIEKTKFVYSEEFFKLDEFDKQKYNKDKMTTEAHLSTLCELLWGKKMQFDNGLGSMFALGILSSMFGGGWGSPSTGQDYLKKALDDDEKKEKEQVYMIPKK
jgi:hypothetical protein